jgi:hypothetical protein
MEGNSSTSAVVASAGRALVKSVHDEGTFLGDKRAPTVPTPLPDFVEHFAGKYNLDEANTKVYRSRDPATAQAATSARTAADVLAAGFDEVKIGHTINAGDYVVVVGPKVATAAPATGKCPHCIVFPSVARSSLT